jgi:hypothetical protein
MGIRPAASMAQPCRGGKPVSARAPSHRLQTRLFLHLSRFVGVLLHARSRLDQYDLAVRIKTTSSCLRSPNTRYLNGAADVFLM